MSYASLLGGYYTKSGAVTLLDQEEYYVQTEWDGWENTLNFTLPINHEQAVDFYERLRLAVTDEIEGRKGQIYTISGYNKNGKTLSITAELDLDELRAGMALDWSKTDTLANTIKAVLPENWSVVDNTGRTDTQAIEDFCGTPLELIEKAVETWADVAAQFDNVQRTVTLYSTTANTAKGAYFTTDLNLTETPSIRGKAASGTYYNRLYLRGKDGLALPTPGYVENLGYSTRIVSAYKEEGDIENQAELVAKAIEMVAAASVPDRAYTCKLVDLYRLQPEKYAFLAYGMYDIIVLLDPDTYNRAYQRVNRICTYPHYPEKNTVVLSTVPGTITNTIKQAASRAALARKQAQDAQNQAEDANENANQANQQANEALAQAIQAIQDAAEAASKADSAAERAAAIDTAYKAADAAAKAYADAISARVDSVNEAYQAADAAAKNTYDTKLSQLETKTKDASNITAGTLDAAKVNVINLDAGKITTGALNADLITAGALNASIIKGGTLDASQITVKNLDAGSITTGSFNASLIKTGVLDAGLIKSGTIDAIDIHGSKITGATIVGSSIRGGSDDDSLNWVRIDSDGIYSSSKDFYYYDEDGDDHYKDYGLSGNGMNARVYLDTPGTWSGGLKMEFANGILINAYYSKS